MEHGVHHVLPDAECVLVPMADGGEGTVQSLVDATGGTLLEATVTGPLGTPVHAQYGMLGDGCTAVIEMAAASGIGYVDETTRDPRITTTYGVGELILDALDHGVTAFILGLGGSATNDGERAWRRHSVRICSMPKVMSCPSAARRSPALPQSMFPTLTRGSPRPASVWPPT